VGSEDDSMIHNLGYNDNTFLCEAVMAAANDEFVAEKRSETYRISTAGRN
jgi:hypothetical protein